MTPPSMTPPSMTPPSMTPPSMSPPSKAMAADPFFAGKSQGIPAKAPQQAEFKGGPPVKGAPPVQQPDSVGVTAKSKGSGSAPTSSWADSEVASSKASTSSDP